MSSNPDLSTDDLAGRGAERPQEAGEGRPADRPGVPPTGDPGSGQTAVGTGQQDVGGVGSRDERYADASDPAAGVQGGDRTSADIPTQQMSSGVGATASTGDTGSLQDRSGRASATPGGEQRGDRDVGLLDPSDEQRFRQQWSDAQARFVDDPREAVQTADGLVAELMQSLAQGFSEHKGRLESQWQSGGDPDTEELRQALQRYRSFFNRLLST